MDAVTMAQVQQMLVHKTLVMQVIPLNSVRLSTVRMLSLCTSINRIEANVIYELTSVIHQKNIQWHFSLNFVVKSSSVLKIQTKR